MPEQDKLSKLPKALLLEHLKMAQLFLTHQDAKTLGMGEEQQEKALGHVIHAIWEMGEL